MPFIEHFEVSVFELPPAPAEIETDNYLLDTYGMYTTRIA